MAARKLNWKTNCRKALLAFTVLLLVSIVTHGVMQAMGPGKDQIIAMQKARDEHKNMLPIGTMAPNFILPGVDGKDYELSSYRGKKLVLVEIFASWCPHCQASSLPLKAIYGQYSKKLEILSINAGDKPPMKSTSKEFQAAYGIPYPILEEPSDTLMAAYQLESYPTMYLVGKDGKIIYAHNGELRLLEQAQLKEAIDNAK